MPAGPETGGIEDGDLMARRRLRYISRLADTVGLMRGTLYIVSAPSGSGKTTLLRQLIRNFDGLIFSVSYTTRPPRGDEEHGTEYFFVRRDEFLKMVDANEFLEWAEYQGNLYGTSRGFVEESLETGADVILDIDVQGARQVQEKVADAVTVFLLPPSYAELERRLRERRLEDDETIRMRLAIAKQEITRYKDYDYIVVNDEIDESVLLLGSIVRSGSARPDRQEGRIREIMDTFGGVD
jgi:guanylate kinase